ncbi:hypothetical protein ANN_21400 [Periplaneta americana]|uniref:PPPDE domain-containing protein n=1 Tax=Periplaneta americana TaxID=6978 RepID=A0ABQ8SF63_PERAM|nr:hypothetical protein ANN_21400 [Periplaneta americana]
MESVQIARFALLHTVRLWLKYKHAGLHPSGPGSIPSQVMMEFVVDKADSGTILGEPDQILNLGETFIPYQVFLEYVLGLGETTFSPGAYDLFKHNCNNFTNEVSQFLCGKGIPKYILDVPEEILSTPIGQSLRPLIDSLSEGARGVTFGQNASNGLRDYEPQSRRERAESPDFLELNTAIDEVRRNSVALEERRNVINEKLAKKERKKKKKREKREKGRESGGSSSAELTPDSCSSTTELTPDSCCSSSRNSSRRPSNMADSEAADVIELTANGSDESNKKSPADVAAEIEEQEAREKKEREERKKNREPPIVYKDAVDVRVDFDALVGLVDGILGPEEQQSLEELHQYMLEDEGSWALGDGFLNFVGRLLHDKSLKPEIRVRILNVLAAAALKDDVILLLHQDRREHVLMNYAHDVDRLSIEEQEALALFICNMFENLSSSEWLLYISEWQYCNTTISNIRCTTKVAVNSLLSDNAVLQERGSAIIHNLACKEVKTVVCIPPHTSAHLSMPSATYIPCSTSNMTSICTTAECLACMLCILNILDADFLKSSSNFSEKGAPCFIVWMVNVAHALLWESTATEHNERLHNALSIVRGE